MQGGGLERGGGGTVHVDVGISVPGTNLRHNKGCQAAASAKETMKRFAETKQRNNETEPEIRRPEGVLGSRFSVLETSNLDISISNERTSSHNTCI